MRYVTGTYTGKLEHRARMDHPHTGFREGTGPTCTLDPVDFAFDVQGSALEFRPSTLPCRRSHPRILSPVVSCPVRVQAWCMITAPTRSGRVHTTWKEHRCISTMGPHGPLECAEGDATPTTRTPPLSPHLHIHDHDARYREAHRPHRRPLQHPSSIVSPGSSWVFPGIPGCSPGCWRALQAHLPGNPRVILDFSIFTFSPFLECFGGHHGGMRVYPLFLSTILKTTPEELQLSPPSPSIYTRICFVCTL